MLQYSTVEPRTLEVLRKLLVLPELHNFHLAGGTALALYYGHRLSVDLDFFHNRLPDRNIIVGSRKKIFFDFSYTNPNTVGIFGFIGNVKVDFIRYHHHPLIGTPHIEDGITLTSKDDIMAMKVAAILKRAVKKDFWDIAELLDHYTMDDLINCYNKKYPSHQLLISIPQALTYFADAEESEAPISLKGQTWASVKKKIRDSVSLYLR